MNIIIDSIPPQYHFTITMNIFLIIYKHYKEDQA